MITEKLDPIIAKDMNYIDRREHRFEQIKASVEHCPGYKVKLILATKARNNLLCHVTYNPPCNVGYKQDSWLLIHNDSSLDSKLIGLRH
jgi:hypothetical protein